MQSFIFKNRKNESSRGRPQGMKSEEIQRGPV